MRQGWADIQPWVEVAEQLGLEEDRSYGLFEGRVDGVLVRAWVRWGEVRVRGFVDAPYGLQIVPESLLSRIGQILFGRDLQVGVPAIDDALRITSRTAHGAAAQLVSSREAREALAKAVHDGWQLSLIGQTLELSRPRPDGPETLAAGVRQLVRLARALSPLEHVDGDARSAVRAVAERYQLTYGGGSVHGQVGQAWLLVDEDTVDGLPVVRIRTTAPGLLELTVRRRVPTDSARGIGDPVLDAMVVVLAVEAEDARELLCHEPVRGCVLELVHGAGATLDGGRIDVVAPDDVDRVLALVDAALTLRQATG